MEVVSTSSFVTLRNVEVTEMEESIGRLRGDRIRLLRDRRKMTQQDLATLMKTDARQIWRYEKEKTNPNSEVVRELAYYLETNSRYLLGESDDDTPEMKEQDLSAEERSIIIGLRRRPGLKQLVLGALNDASE
jgi:transcriptional regulator with XRE-family HTH domain